MCSTICRGWHPTLGAWQNPWSPSYGLGFTPHESSVRIYKGKPVNRLQMATEIKIHVILTWQPLFLFHKTLRHSSQRCISTQYLLHKVFGLLLQPTLRRAPLHVTNTSSFTHVPFPYEFTWQEDYSAFKKALLPVVIRTYISSAR